MKKIKLAGIIKVCLTILSNKKVRRILRLVVTSLADDGKLDINERIIIKEEVTRILEDQFK